MSFDDTDSAVQETLLSEKNLTQNVCEIEPDAKITDYREQSTPGKVYVQLYTPI